MRFHPKRRASSDHRPGPNIASAAPQVATRRYTNLSPVMETSLKLSISATRVPTIGVNSPMMRRTAAAARSTAKIVKGMAGLLSRTEPALLTKANPTTSRIKIRPIPGQPPANVEYKRRKGRTSRVRIQFLMVSLRNRAPHRGLIQPLLRRRGR